MDFGEVVVGTREQRTLILTNTGDAELLVDDISVPAPFQAMDRGLTLAPGESARITIVLRPKATDVPRDPRLVLASSALPDGSIDVPIRATVTLPAAISVDPLSIDFGQVDVYGKAQAVITIENKGERALRIKNLSSPRPFHVEVAELTLDAGERQQVEVSFAPDKEGDGKANLLVRSDDPKRSLLMVTLKGSGVAAPPQPVIEVSAARIDFGKVSLSDKRQRWIYVRNHGADALHVTSLTASPPFKTPGKGRRVKPGGSMRVAVSFEPTDAGTEVAPLLIHSNDPEKGVLVVDLFGEGTHGAGDQESEVASHNDRILRGGGSDGGGAGATPLSESAPIGEDGQPIADGTDDGGSATGDTPEDPAALGFDPTVGDESYVYIGTIRSQISAADVQGISVDPVTGRFSMTQLMLPPVEFPLGGYFEFPPIDIAGEMSVNGDISIPINVVMITEAGNEISVPMILTNGTATGLLPDGRQVSYPGTPFDGDGTTLYAVGRPEAGPVKDEIVVVKVQVTGSS